ncbi:MAG: hypothetical protein JRG73_04110 [Deltaproteobacteria bacterium]|nr:hypothetical protein [Deltaproteobacteria bacterium]
MKTRALSFVVPVVLWCVFSTNSIAATIDVAMRDSFFLRSDITINVGDTVRWTNEGSLLHTTTSGTSGAFNGIWDSGTMSQGDTFSFRFNQVGTFPYFCRFHVLAGMTGTVTVQSAAAPLPTGQDIFSYDASNMPSRNQDPSMARPIGVGAVADNGDTFKISVDLGGFAGEVDVYFAIFAPSLVPDDFFILTSDNTIQLLSDGLVPWMTNTPGDITVNVFGDLDLPLSVLPPGTYELFLAVTPAGSFDSFFTWQTGFTVP